MYFLFEKYRGYIKDKDLNPSLDQEIVDLGFEWKCDWISYSNNENELIGIKKNYWDAVAELI